MNVCYQTVKLRWGFDSNRLRVCVLLVESVRFTGPTNMKKCKINFKTISHSIIHIFKNYFVTVFSAIHNIQTNRSKESNYKRISSSKGLDSKLDFPINTLIQYECYTDHITCSFLLHVRKEKKKKKEVKYFFLTF